MKCVVVDAAGCETHLVAFHRMERQNKCSNKAKGGKGVMKYGMVNKVLKLTGQGSRIDPQLHTFSIHCLP